VLTEVATTKNKKVAVLQVLENSAMPTKLNLLIKFTDSYTEPVFSVQQL
jgi:hypothetical protein